MFRSFLVLMMMVVGLCGCSHESEPPPPALPTQAAPTVAATRVVAAPSALSSAGLVAATPVPDASDNALPYLEDLLEDKPSGADFEIDGAASSYYAPVGSTVSFRAKALNGSPPITFTWTFGDGSEEAHGERVEHTYDKLGSYRALVVGEDANKEHSSVQFALLFVTAQQFVDTMHLDPKLLENVPSPGASAATPAAAAPTPAAP
jgi:hypothetical protein